ncbi:MAG: aminotransferase class I/II-fold pyridoxal phosphate-dependent enzyme [Acidimicrobiia bacterium]|nr:aminotransferase class I/II-fold pyridoxal phosphate-dependent enzyme [Acidimicrobiia bacterium]
MVVMRINPVLKKIGTYPMAVIQDRARAMREAGVALIDFSIGDPREPTPPFIPQALRDAVPEISQYPTSRGLQVLREAIAGYVLRRFGREVDPDTQVLPTTGSKEAIFSTPFAFVDSRREDVVIWPTPGYPVYGRGALLAGASGHPVRLGEDFILRASDVPDQVWARAVLAWTNSPHNPAGSVMARSDIESLYQKCQEFGVLLCADECYVDLYEDDPPASVLEVADSDLSGVVSFLSLSKRSGMTGYRSAAMVGDARAIRALASLRTSTGTAPPEFTQMAAVAAWSDDDHVVERRQIFSEKRAILRKAFGAMGYRTVGSTAGLYLWVEVEDDIETATHLLERGVVVSAGRAFGPGGEGYIRLALVPSPEECKQAVEVLEECLTRM